MIRHILVTMQGYGGLKTREFTDDPRPLFSFAVNEWVRPDLGQELGVKLRYIDEMHTYLAKLESKLIEQDRLYRENMHELWDDGVDSSTGGEEE